MTTTKKQLCEFCYGDKRNPAKFKMTYWRAHKYDWDKDAYLTYVACGLHLYRACTLPELTRGDSAPVVERI